MAKIISLCNQKGGVGKTSTAVSLASGLALEKKRTLLIDLDPQANATSGLGIDKRSLQKSIYHAIADEESLNSILVNTQQETLKLIPSNDALSGAEVELVSVLGREGRLKRLIQPISDSFDYIIIDCPPSFGLLTINALTASDSVIVPIQCEYYALEGLSQLMKTIQLVKDNLNSSLEIEGILMTMADFRTNLTQEVIKEVQKHFLDKVYDAVIPRNIRLSEAPGFGKSIFLYDKESEGAKKYKEFVREFLKKQPRTSNPLAFEQASEQPGINAPEQALQQTSGEDSHG